MTTPARTNTQLPVPKVLAGAAELLWQRRSSFLDYILPATLVLSVIQTSLVLGISPSEVEGPGERDPVAEMRASLLPMLVLVPPLMYFGATFAVAWHRLILLPKMPQTPLSSLLWTSRHTRFLGYLLVLAALSFLLTMLGTFLVGGLMRTPVGAASGLALMVAVSTVVVYARFAPVLPAAAIDHALKLGECWSLTRGQGGRLVAVMAVAFLAPNLVTTIFQTLLFALFDASASFMGVFVREFLGNLMSFAGLAYLVGVVSLAYDYLRVGRPPSVELTIS